MANSASTNLLNLLQKICFSSIHLSLCSSNSASISSFLSRSWFSANSYTLISSIHHIISPHRDFRLKLPWFPQESKTCRSLHLEMCNFHLDFPLSMSFNGSHIEPSLYGCITNAIALKVLLGFSFFRCFFFFSFLYSYGRLNLFFQYNLKI